MKRFVHGLLVAMLFVGNMAAKTYHDKTFLMPRSHGMNIAMEYTTWHKQMSMIDDDKFGATIQATGFYEESENKKDLGEYFGTRNWLNGSNCINDFLVVVPDSSFTTPPIHFYASDIFHLDSATATDQVLADKLTWRPYRRAYGIRLDYHQKLDKLLKGLFFKVTLPIVHVKTSMGWTSSCACATSCETSCATSCETTCDSSCTTTLPYCVRQRLVSGGTFSGDLKSVGDYLTGCVSNSDEDAAQRALCKLKIHNGKTETGIADIDFMLGYNFLYKPTKHVNVSVAVTVPTGTTPDSEWIFEPIVGNAGHWALGFGMDSAFQVWKNEDMSLDFLAAFNYRYLFSSTEKRVPGFVYPEGFTNAGNRVMYGHWILGAKKGENTTTPMANFLAQDVKVTPGSHFDGILQLAFNYSGWTFDLGYNLFAKEEENVKSKCGDCCTPCETSCSTACATSCATDCGVGSACGWEDDTYGIPFPTWDTSNDFSSSYLAYNQGLAAEWLQTRHLCFDACTNPSVVTHKIYGGIGYAFNDWEYPLMLGIGGSYEFETDNDCLEAWSLWAKIGLTF